MFENEGALPTLPTNESSFSPMYDYRMEMRAPHFDPTT